jgi:hypothetical protein
MTKISQIDDRGAVVAWSPVGEFADVIALGSKVCVVVVVLLLVDYRFGTGLQ